jgi:ribosomal protein S18 acetylase RimI-like enzyme
MPTIRLATPADAPALADLRYEFRSSVNTAVEDRDAFVRRCAAWMAQRLAAGSPWRCWVAEDGGRIVGHLWLSVVEKIPNPVPEPETHVYITNVYVDPAHRGGTGTALLEAALAYARQLGADAAILWPTEGSRSLYRRYGFETTEDIMQAIVAPGRELH